MTDPMTSTNEQAFRQRLAALRERIDAACRTCGRNVREIDILPVTKTHGPEVVEWCQRAGLERVGENRVQEAAAKKAHAVEHGWELIGHLQSNKAKLAVDTFVRVQSVDSAKLAARLGRFAEEAGRVLPILLQVNAGDDPAKFGCEVDAAPTLFEAALSVSGVRVEGLMTIAPLSDDPAIAQRTFGRLRTLRDSLEKEFDQPLPVLSMGMTGDMEHAIEAGSTQIRVGTALFGKRTQGPWSPPA